MRGRWEEAKLGINSQHWPTLTSEAHNVIRGKAFFSYYHTSDLISQHRRGVTDKSWSRSSSAPLYLGPSNKPPDLFFAAVTKVATGEKLRTTILPVWSRVLTMQGLQTQIHSGLKMQNSDKIDIY